MLYLFLMFNSLDLSLVLADTIGEITFDRIGDKNSIPRGTVTSLLQDEQGFIWVGTQFGLVRYDGYQFRVFKANKKHSGSITGNFITTLFQSSDGRIWIGTESDGVSVFNPKTELFFNYRHNNKHKTSLASNRIFAFAEDKNSGVWIATDNGLNYWHKSKDGFKHYRNSLSDSHVGSLLYDNNYQLWAGTRNGLNLFQSESDSFEPVLSNPLDADSLAKVNIQTLFQANSGKIWFGSVENGAGWFQPSNPELHYLPVDENNLDALTNTWVTSIIQTKSDQLWIATYGGGINVIDTKSNAIIKQWRNDAAVSSSISFDSIGALLKDSSGSIWVGTWGGGLNRTSLGSGAFQSIYHSPTKKDSLSHADILEVLELNDGRWLLGTGGNGIDIFDPSKGVIGGFRANKENSTSLSSNSVYAMAQSDDGYVWVGTRQGGLNLLDLRTGQFQQFNQSDGLIDNRIRELITSDNGVWVGTDAGLSFFDSKSKQFSHFLNQDGSPFVERIRKLLIDHFGDLWVASSSGLYHLKKDDKHLQRFFHDPNQQDSLSSDNVTGLLEDSKNRLWVDTSEGLNLLTKVKGNIARFESVNNKTNQQGLYFGANLLEDELGRIWTQWNMLDPSTWQSWPLTEADGIDIGTAWVGSYTKTRDGRLLFGGTQGLLIIEPEKFTPWNYQPKLVISELSIDGKTQLIDDVLTIPPDAIGFSLLYSALDFSAPNKNKYLHKLEGMETDWIQTEADNRRVTYTNLAPGEYRLKIKGSNRLGQWSPNEISLPIIVLPAWYQTLWAYVIYFALFFGSLFLFVRLQRNKVTLARIRIEQEQKLNTDLRRVNKLKDEILANTSHELRTPLHGIIGLSESLVECDSGELSKDTIDSLQFITESGQRLLVIINNILELTELNSTRVTLNKKPISITNYVDKAIANSTELIQKKELTLTNKVEENLPLVSADPDRLLQILLILIENAIKFSHHGTIQVNAFLREAYIDIIVSDTGIGIELDSFDDIFKMFYQVDGSRSRAYEGSGLSLSICKRLVNLHGGEISVQSKAGKGTVFTFSLPTH